MRIALAITDALAASLQAALPGCVVERALRPRHSLAELARPHVIVQPAALLSERETRSAWREDWTVDVCLQWKLPADAIDEEHERICDLVEGIKSRLQQSLSLQLDLQTASLEPASIEIDPLFDDEQLVVAGVWVTLLRATYKLLREN
ncbi:hypothetical protein RAS1_14290 [Phycisphaerae bacterium RAS1]|nr:hypothetical protein RAS1_14290 [Phycisphaerae bacterium RAS1]